LALATAVLFFASILAHELSHAIVARQQDIPVHRITLFIFGGLAHMERQPPTPKSEFLMAVVGPITSLVIGVAATLGGLALAGDATGLLERDPAAAMRALGPASTLLMWLGPINILLGLFNLVPGFPLDGGRVLRSALWWGTGDLVKATRWASGAGQVFAWVLMGIGVMSLFRGAFVQGFWLLLIGWFLNNAARMSYHQLIVRRALENVPVARLMYTQVQTVSQDLTVERLVREHLMIGDQQAFPVVDAAGSLVGLVTLDDVRGVPHEQWPRTPIARLMTPVDRLRTLPPQAAAEQALEELGRRDIEQIPVLDRGHVLGLVRRRDLVRWLALQQESGAPIAL
jgi:Zn-dependent protease/CBS domain-containing protein